ncbi:MAG: GPP34 family phosphoprotein [Streptosporangiaceae bacterium]
MTAGVLADLVLAGRVALREMTPGWRRGVHRLDAASHRLCVFAEDTTAPGDAVLDAALAKISQRRRETDLAWWIGHVCPRISVFTHLLERGVIERSGYRGTVSEAVAGGVRRRLEQTLDGPGVTDARTAAVVLLARAGGFFDPKKNGHNTISSAAPTVVRERMNKLASLPSVAPVHPLVGAIAEIRGEKGRKTDVAVWQLSS